MQYSVNFPFFNPFQCLCYIEICTIPLISDFTSLFLYLFCERLYQLAREFSCCFVTWVLWSGLPRLAIGQVAALWYVRHQQHFLPVKAWLMLLHTKLVIENRFYLMYWLNNTNLLPWKLDRGLLLKIKSTKNININSNIQLSIRGISVTEFWKYKNLDTAYIVSYESS